MPYMPIIFRIVKIDYKSDKILNKYSQEPPLFTNAEIIKMLISQVIRKKQTLSFKQILSGQEFLNIEDQNAQFKWLVDNGLDRKSP